MNRTAILLTVYFNDSYSDFKDAIASLYCQTNLDFDIFVQEDGEINSKIHGFLINELKDKKIKFLGERSVNKGFDYSLNELIKLVMNLDYEYIVRMDSDDISNPERIERQLVFMESNPSIDVCGTNIQEFGDGFNYNKIVTYPLNHKDMFNFFNKRVPLAHVSAFFRRSYFVKAGLYRVDGHLNNGDTLMWMNGFMNGCNFANIDIVGVRVRVTSSFFNRRGGWKKTTADFKNRILVNKNLHYGVASYFYAFFGAGINLLPSIFKKYAYRYLRK
jgi:hypothetical protein